MIRTFHVYHYDEENKQINKKFPTMVFRIMINYFGLASFRMHQMMYRELS